jgi:hypothetical protein
LTPPSSIQRYSDVKEEYQYADRSPEEKLWLDDFKRIQELLSSETRVWAHLLTLNNLMYQAGTGVSETLTTQETQQGYSDVKPMFLKATTEPAFKAVVSRGQQFLDLVAVAHGTHTHRLQWCIVGLEIDQHPDQWNHTAVQLYQESVNPHWRRKTGALPNMWDLIVDSSQGFSPSATDFTRPENLETYIVRMQDWSWYLFNGGFWIRHLAASYKRAHNELATQKEFFNSSAPEEAKGENMAITTTATGQWTGQTASGPTVLYPPGSNVSATGTGIDPTKVQYGFGATVTK